MDYQLSKKAIFLDRDGVINKEVDYLYKLGDFEFIEGIFEACNYIQKLGYSLIIVTNQSGIARGFFSENDFHVINNWMIDQFSLNNVNILDVFFCPHSNKSNCECRKPKSGMLIEAKNKHNINMGESWMIGDSERDVIAASSAGIKNSILVRSGHEIDEENSKAKFYLDSIKDISNLIKY
jgi:D-glycero-D-manno-heptose 1,7-bisphosphate phosphatase